MEKKPEMESSPSSKGLRKSSGGRKSSTWCISQDIDFQDEESFIYCPNTEKAPIPFLCDDNSWQLFLQIGAVL